MVTGSHLWQIMDALWDSGLDDDDDHVIEYGNGYLCVHLKDIQIEVKSTSQGSEE